MNNYEISTNQIRSLFIYFIILFLMGLYYLYDKNLASLILFLYTFFLFVNYVCSKHIISLIINDQNITIKFLEYRYIYKSFPIDSIRIVVKKKIGFRGGTFYIMEFYMDNKILFEIKDRQLKNKNDFYYLEKIFSKQV